MKSLKRSLRGFTLIELLVVISIIAILASFAVPAVSSAMGKGQMIQTVNNASQLQKVTYTMSIDTGNNGDGWSWTTSNGVPQQSLSAFAQALVDGRYLTPMELRKLFTAQGVIIPMPPAGITNINFTADNVAFRVIQTTDNSPSDQIFLITKNWRGGKLDANASPYGEKGFVICRKGGDAAMFTRPQDANSPNVVGTNMSVLGYYLQ